MTGDDLAKALGGARVGAGWMARCPVHRDNTPSLSISLGKDGRSLVHCHAGCEQAAVIEVLRTRGLWGDAKSEGSDPRHLARRRQPVADDHRRRTAVATKLWCSAQGGAESLVVNYLAGRGIRVDVPARLRFHPALDHRGGSIWPAMIALVTHGTDDRPLGIHRTWLDHDGRSKAPVSPNKMMLGPCRGGAVRLAPRTTPLLVGEGIETCLSAMQVTGHAAWAALSTSGMRALELPPAIRHVIILADGDLPGKAAADALACRLSSEGRRVRIARAPDGLDFNDLLVLPVRDECAP